MFHHIPVLLRETIAWLNVRPDGLYIDGTLGGGGHSEAILEAGARVIGIDRDAEALAASAGRLIRFGDRLTQIHGNFHDMKALVDSVSDVDGVLFDLGVSSHQLDTGGRGFSYHTDAPLDMRMDRRQALTAREIVNAWGEKEIAEILLAYGDEKWAARIARIIVEHREQSPLTTTADLVRAVDAAIPRKIRDRDAGHPAQKTFQALRIAVNDEIGPLGAAIADAVSLLRPGGRLCVIAFHSIEDRAVKRALRRMENPCTCPSGLPACVCGHKPSVRLPVRGGVKPSPEEIADNPRARSALLRVAERI